MMGIFTKQPDAAKERDRVHREFVAAQDRLMALSAEVEAARLAVGRARAAGALGETADVPADGTVERIQADMRRQEALVQGLRERLIQADEAERRGRPVVAVTALNALTKQTPALERAVLSAAQVLEVAQEALGSHRASVKAAEAALEAAKAASLPLPKIVIFRGDADVLESAINEAGCTINRVVALRHIHTWRAGITRGRASGHPYTYKVGEAVLVFNHLTGEILRATPTRALQEQMQGQWVPVFNHEEAGLLHYYSYADAAILAEAEGKLAEAV